MRIDSQHETVITETDVILSIFTECSQFHRRTRWCWITRKERNIFSYWHSLDLWSTMNQLMILPKSNEIDEERAKHVDNPHFVWIWF